MIGESNRVPVTPRYASLYALLDQELGIPVLVDLLKAQTLSQHRIAILSKFVLERLAVVATPCISSLLSRDGRECQIIEGHKFMTRLLVNLTPSWMATSLI